MKLTDQDTAVLVYTCRVVIPQVDKADQGGLSSAYEQI